MNQYLIDEKEFSQRAQYWLEKSRENPKKHLNKRRDRRPLIICGHGAQLKIDRGTLFVRNGFTHYPQQREEFRFFKGDPHLPTRIIISDASGSISFDVLQWLSEQEIPVVQLCWNAEPLIIANANYAADPKIVARQYAKLENGQAQKEIVGLIRQKFKNSISTILLLPENAKTKAAIKALEKADRDIAKLKHPTTSQIIGIEGVAAARYFAAWRGIPLQWKLNRRQIIPPDWHFIGGRRSALGKSNRNARHPINAMLNYAYAVLYSQLKLQLIAQGYDPTIGLSHTRYRKRGSLVLDRMEPLRPVVDGVIVKLALDIGFSPSDFLITTEGFCRLNSQFTRLLATKVAALPQAN